MFIYKLVIEKRENIKQSIVFESSPKKAGKLGRAEIVPREIRM